MSRNYRKEYDNYHSRPEQKIRRAARNAARSRFKDADPNKDVHHKDNNPLNNDKNNLSLVTQHYNRREPRLRQEAVDVKKLLAKVKGLSKQHIALLTQLPMPVLISLITALYGLTMGEDNKFQIEELEEMSAIDDKQFRNKVAQLIQISGRNDTAGLETRVMYQSSDALRKSTRAFQLHFQKQRSSNVRELIAKAVNKAMDKKAVFFIWDAPFAKMITAFGEDVQESFDTDAKKMVGLMQKYINTKNKKQKVSLLKDINKLQLKLGLEVTETIEEGLTDPQELAKEIEWGVSPKNVDSRVLSTKQKKQMKDIVKLMKRSKAPNWVSKFTQVYFTSDKLVQQRLKSAAKRGGMSSELMKKLFKEDMGTVTGPHIAGTGDDSSTVKVRKRKKVRRRKTESKSNRMSPSMRDWEDRNKLAKQIRAKFWKSFKKDKKKDVNMKFKLKNSKSLKKRVIDNVLAIQQKV